MVTLTGVSALKAFTDFYGDPVGCVEKMYARHGPVIALKAPLLKPSGVPQSYLFVGPEFNKKILLNQERFRPTGAWPTPGKEGVALQNLRRNILCMRGEEHDAHLAAILPLMGRPQVRAFFDRAKAITTEEVGAWPVGERIDITRLARRLTQRLAFELLFGARSAEESLKFGVLVDAFHQNSWSRGALSFRMDAPLTPYAKLLRSAEKLESYSMEWTAQERHCPAHSNIRAAAANVWLPNGEKVSLTQAAANVAAIGMAAYETSALTLAWTLFLLTQHPDALKALLSELNAAGPLAALDAEAIDSLPLLDGAVKETMRLVAPVPVIGFEVMEDCAIDDVALHRGARVFISPHLTHRMESIYERPRRFMPERWASIKPSAYEYLPFNAGPRRCPGIWFASANLKIALAAIGERFRFDLAPSAKIDRGYAATTIAKNGVPMIFSPRDGRCARSPCAGDIMKFFDMNEAVQA